jgi:hypothetical protein
MDAHGRTLNAPRPEKLGQPLGAAGWANSLGTDAIDRPWPIQVTWGPSKVLDGRNGLLEAGSHILKLPPIVDWKSRPEGLSSTGRWREVSRRHFSLGPPLHGTFCNTYSRRCNTYSTRTLTIERHRANAK